VSSDNGFHVFECGVIVEDHPPPRLYKFLKRDHALSLVHAGFFRIGTLRDYRRTEHYKSDVADPGEGTAVLKESIRGYRPKEELGWAARQVFSFGAGVQGGGLANLTVLNNVEGDLYVYCLHDSNSRSCRADNEYDTCIEIRDSLGFASALSSSLRLDQIGIGCCRYDDREHEVQGATPPPVALMKPKRFANQREWRFLWQTERRLPASPFLVMSRTAARFCRIVPSSP
jgi:hypothetical protein